MTQQAKTLTQLRTLSFSGFVSFFFLIACQQPPSSTPTAKPLPSISSSPSEKAQPPSPLPIHKAAAVNPSRDVPRSLAEKSTEEQLIRPNPVIAKLEPLAQPPPPQPPTEEQLLDTAIAGLKQGNLAYNTPSAMKTGETALITASIGSSQVSLQDLKSGIPADQQQNVQVLSTPVSPVMKMTLTSADFAITPLSSQEQIVAGATPTTWQWDIIPNHSGNLQLHLAATVELNNLSKDFTTINRDITVKVDPVGALSSFVQTNWQWLIASLTTLVGVIWRFLAQRKKKKDVNSEATAP